MRVQHHYHRLRPFRREGEVDRGSSWAIGLSALCLSNSNANRNGHLPTRKGYCSNTNGDLGFRCGDGNIVFTQVQPHLYRVRRVEPCHQQWWSSQALILNILALVYNNNNNNNNSSCFSPKLPFCVNLSVSITTASLGEWGIWQLTRFKKQRGVRRLRGRRCLPLGTHWMTFQIPATVGREIWWKRAKADCRRQISICVYYYNQNGQSAFAGFHRFSRPTMTGIWKRHSSSALGVIKVFPTAA